jgi:hypothetical protein
VTFSLEGGVSYPKIYGYTTPQFSDTPWVGGREGAGLIKVGYTGDDVAKRIKQQIAGVKMPGGPQYDLLVSEPAIDANREVFKDHQVHAALVAAGVFRIEGEWFEVTQDEVLAAIDAVRKGTKPTSLKHKLHLEPRPEQEDAVGETAAYFEAHADSENPPHFLWNAKMRFGKTFATYELARTMGWERILVLTYKPAVESSWRADLEETDNFEGWRFKGKADPAPDLDEPGPVVWFASFQDVLGTDDSGQPKVKNEDLYLATWDVVVIDEYHFGAWRDAARDLYLAAKGDDSDAVGGDSNEKAALDTPDLDEGFASTVEAQLALDVRHYLYLSGTPFRALTEGEFLEDQVFNWTYADEQRAKTAWSGPGANPYRALPQMHLFAYEMPDALREVALNHQSQFSLTEFFSTEPERAADGTVRFLHEYEVQKWLDLLRGQDLTGLWSSVTNSTSPPLPYEDTNLLRALQHTIWYLPTVASCEAMRDLLTAGHNTFFHEYTVVVAAGAGAGIGAKALPRVLNAIGSVPQISKTITLSCGKLMTGVTVPAWAGIMMLRELRSPESYFQAAFRVQSPWVSKLADTVEGGELEVIHKEHCYVFDFSPNRALSLVADYATRLRSEIAAERDDEAAITEFLEFLPVLSFDGFGMRSLSASDVINYLTAGVTSSMLARRWNSPELLTLDLKAMEALLNDTELIGSLEQIEMFRNIGDDLTAMISSNKELGSKKVAGETPSTEEKQRGDEAKNKRDDLRKRLQRFVTRIPVFMYLTDDRERKVKDIIEQVEPDLFAQVTGLTLPDFGKLVNAGVFNDSKMDDAVWKFRVFEEPSLRYGQIGETSHVQGGWSVRRDDRFAALLDKGPLEPGDVLVGMSGEEAAVTENYGLTVAGIRYDTPDDAQRAAGDDGNDGWEFWSYEDGGQVLSLAALADLYATDVQTA